MIPTYETLQKPPSRLFMQSQLWKFELADDFEDWEKKMKIIICSIGKYYFNLIQKAQRFLEFCKVIRKSQKQVGTKEFVIKKIKTMKSDDETQLTRLIEKLKVLIRNSIKIRSFEETKYYHRTYLSRIENTLYFQGLSDELCRKNYLLKEIRSIFSFINIPTLRKHKIHLSRHPLFFQEKAIFYLNFSIPQILTFQNISILFPNNLLYCPIIDKEDESKGDEVKVSVTVSNWYLRILQFCDYSWENFQIFIVIRKKRQPFLYYVGNNNIFENGFDSELISFLRKIRYFIYLNQIKKWIWKIYGKEESENLFVNLLKDYTLQISFIQDEYSIKKGQEQPKLFENLMNFSFQNHYGKERQRLRKQFIYSYCFLIKDFENKLKSTEKFNKFQKYAYDKKNNLIDILS